MLRLRDLTGRFQNELKDARKIQFSILPKSLPQHDHAKLTATYIPFEAVGGDLYDLWKLDEHRLGLFIADVTGHGLAAAFLGAMTKMAMTYAPQTRPDEILKSVNDGLAALMPEGRFVTALMAIVDFSNDTLYCARAGHPPLYLWKHQEKKVEMLTPNGLPLGVMGGMDYQQIETQLEPGDKFVMVTDGITETIDMDGNILGNEGVVDGLSQVAADHDIIHCAAHMLEYQKEFSQGRIVKDDNTILGFEYLLKSDS